MGGGLMQLVAYGAQDIYLTGNPQITFFKVVYRRHTNFSMESIEQTFNGTADFGKKVSCTISRNGDLVSRVYLEAKLPAIAAGGSEKACWTNYVGHALIKSVEVEIGGQRIDKHYGEWMHIWNELTQTEGHKNGYAEMVGNTHDLTDYKTAGTDASPTLYIPLQFWFCRNPGLALPLIALQYHEVKVNIEFNDWDNCVRRAKDTVGSKGVSHATMVGASLYVDYIYLDTDERRRFAQVSHEYLIEQLQFTGEETYTGSSSNGATPKVKLNFNHPCKELIWTVQRSDVVTDQTTRQLFNYTDDKLEYGSLSSTKASNAGNLTGRATGPFGAPMGGVNNTGNVANTSETYPVLDKNGLTFSIDSAGVVTVNNDNGTLFESALTKDTKFICNDKEYTVTTSASPNNTKAKVTPTGSPNAQTNKAVTSINGLALAKTAASDVHHAGKNPVAKAKLQLNGHDRFSERVGRYFNLVQPYQHHTNVPATGINVYSFGLKPEEHQPSGTCNMSRIDNATLALTLTKETFLNNASNTAVVKVYATNYNVLRIMSGMGGLAYSN